MAISLNSLNSTVSSYGTRITNLENKIGAGGGIIESSLTNPGYVKFANGLIMNWGTISTPDSVAKTLTFKKAFSSGALSVLVARTSSVADGDHIPLIRSVTATNVTVYGRNTTHILAIGYLISNRILKYISKFLNSVKNLKAVI